MSAPATNPLTGRVTVVLAAAGYGKTTAVRAWLQDRPARWLSGADLADVDCIDVVEGSVTVIDDLHLAPAIPPTATLAPSGRLVLVARRPPPPAAMRWAAGLATEIGPARLALPAAAVGRLLRDTYGVDRPGLAGRVHDFTGGWPALVHLVGTALGSAPGGSDGRGAGDGDDDPLADLAEPGTPLAEYLISQVLEPLPAATRRMLLDTASLASISADLAAAVGHRRPAPAISELARLGLLHPSTPGHRWYRPVPAVAAALHAATPRPAARRRHRVLVTAADWHRDAGRPVDALRLRMAAEDHAGCAELLVEHGADLLAGGAAAAVVTAVRTMPAAHCDQQTDLLLAQALEMTGDSAGAVRVYAALAAGTDALPPALAWRYGVALYLWVDPREALGVYQRGVLGAEDTADEALLLGWTAAAHWLAGDLAACRDHAERAHRAATLSGDGRARATAHVALALCANLSGDPATLQAHYARALELAEAAGDVVQAIRIRANLAVALEREARYADALDMLRPAVALAERAGHASLLAMARCNEAAQLHRLGRLDEAAEGYARSVEIYQRINSRKVAYALNNLGDLHRQRGRRSEARAAYEEAMSAADGDGNRQGLVPALSGLARTLADDDPALAADLADRAVLAASGPLVVAAQLAAGYAVLATGARCAARERAVAAATAARQHRDRAGLAEALELRAAAAADDREARQALGEALAIWRGADAGLEADRVRLALGRVAGARAEERLAARIAAARLAAAGVILPEPPLADPAEPPPVEIRAFGRFAVIVDGVPAPAWQSRKARDLVRILVARRGRPVSRDELVDLLWGQAAGDADKVGHRLAVALSTARGVLDPGRRAPADHFITAGQTNLWLNVDKVAVDVEGFLSDARHGLRLFTQGAADDAHAVLGAVAQAYVGEVFADDPYDEWARALRAEVEAAHLNVLRALVKLGRRAGDPDEVVRHLTLILAAEPYDEHSHRDLIQVLVDAGRHGEARRAYDRYADAMGEIGVSAPDDGILFGARI
jgi:DNA-binding SARP family transcriptional activator